MAGGRLQQQAITLASSSSFSSPLRAKSSLPLHRLLSSSSLSPHASFACRAFSSLSGVHTPQTRKTLGATSQRNSEMRHTHRPAAARTLRFLPSHQRFLHSSSSASSSFSLLSLTSPLSPSSTAFLKHIEYPTQQYRTIVTVRQPTRVHSIGVGIYLSLISLSMFFLPILSLSLSLSISSICPSICSMSAYRPLYLRRVNGV